MFSLKEKIKSLAFNFWLAIQTSVCYMSNNICLYRVPTTQLIAHNILCYTVTPIYNMYVYTYTVLYLYDVYCWQILQAWQKEIAEAVVLLYSIVVFTKFLCHCQLLIHMYTIWIYEKIALALLNTNCYLQYWSYTATLPLRIQNGGPSGKWITHNIMLPTKTMTFKYKIQKLLIKQFQIWSILMKSKLSRG